MKIKLNKGVTVCGPDLSMSDHTTIYKVKGSLGNHLITRGQAVLIESEAETVLTRLDVDEKLAGKLDKAVIRVVDIVQDIKTVLKINDKTNLKVDKILAGVLKLVDALKLPGETDEVNEN
jgi:hypothetical protein